MPFQMKPQPKCPVCNTSVYEAEKVLSAGESWHKKCFKCSLCNKLLDSATVADHDGKLYCKNCHGKMFGPKGYGFGGGAGVLSMDQGERLGNVHKDNAPPAIAQAYVHADVAQGSATESDGGQFGGAPRCPRCAKTVYMAEKVMGAGSAWHKRCFTCAYCSKGLDSTTVADREGEIFCQACYAKGFGPKGYGFGGGSGALQHTE